MPELSPQAQGIKDATRKLYADPIAHEMAWPLDMPVIAAGLKAAADKVVPQTPSPSYPDDYESGAWEANQWARMALLAIVAELESQ
jgi:hypothetical protein